MHSILVIDDDAAVLGSTARILERAGFYVVKAENGREGLEKFKRQACDLVITDMLMPEGDGIEFIRKLRALSPDVPVLAISGISVSNGGASPLPHALAIGASAMLEKPYSPQTLLSTIHSLF